MKPTICYPDIPTLTLYRGIEKEALRVTNNGAVSQQPHPHALGSPLKHPFITTDFSEALTEIITGVHDNLDSLFTELQDINTFLTHHLPADEALWAASMPPFIENEDTIPIAQYGSSHIAQMKYWYRVGLANRYGKIMQSIAGIHYNLSFSPSLFTQMAIKENKTFDTLQHAQSYYYMRLIRHFLVHDWLLVLLFSASPVAAPSSVQQQNLTHLVQHRTGDYYSPHGTSLRLSPIGYHNLEVNHTMINHHNIQQYAADLFRFTHTPSQQFQHLRTLATPPAQQLNHSILQIENEYYNNIRPKPKFISEQLPSSLLYQNGIHYIEIRVFDLNPFLPLGISPSQVLFTDVFCLYCLLHQDINPPAHIIAENKTAVLNSGMDSNLRINTPHGNDRIQQVALNFLQQLMPVAQWLDEHSKENGYQLAVQTQRDTVEQWNGFTNRTLLTHLNDYQNKILSLSQQHRQQSDKLSVSESTQSLLETISQHSRLEQKELEKKNENTSFTQFYQHYLNQNNGFKQHLKRETKP